MSAATSESVIYSAPFREESQSYARPCGLARENIRQQCEARLITADATRNSETWIGMG